jgi:CPA1 family monovalent cation:H+ antiporter
MSDPVVTGVLCVCLFLLAISAVEHYFRRSIIPALCWVMVAGMLYGFAQNSGKLNIPSLSLEPSVVLFIFLPILIGISSFAERSL